MIFNPSNTKCMMNQLEVHVPAVVNAIIFGPAFHPISSSLLEQYNNFTLINYI